MLRVCFGFALLLLAASGVTAEERPNFIIMIADDVSWDDLGAYGHPHIRTPNLDQMAADGVRYDLAFLTCSSCSPSRCSIMTGRYPHSTGAGELHQPLPADQVMFPALLKQAGYYTAAAGKWHLGEPARKAFDRIEDGRPSGCEKWVEVLHERPRDKPFFLWLAAYDAHRGYSKGTLKVPHTNEDAVVPPYLPDAPETRGDLAMYYDEISRLDSYAGKVLAELDEQKAAENTLVLFLADNGRPFPRCKTTVYDSGVRTPFIVRWPVVVPRGSVCRELVSSIDIAPTFCELAGLRPAPTFQGQSFVPQLPTPDVAIRDHIVAEHNWHDYEAYERGLRDQRYLYIRNWRPELPGTPPADAVRSPTYAVMQKMRDAGGSLTPDQRSCFLTPRPEEELYDTIEDPHCLRNLADAPGSQEVLVRMRAAMVSHRKKYDDPEPGQLTPDRFDREEGTPLKK
ncbi:sulfatase family protein [Lignipirellula cremea]|uniref:Arylsulfatase n=1 Tax=Lignipirellula cremea TaxID=2528010 RepID=A0A518DSW2_9BACT|nr:sulfatase [Lignipirellula cremea]QDU94923.1 Arylsulfatase [Lignipirellula cremea]